MKKFILNMLLLSCYVLLPAIHAMAEGTPVIDDGKNKTEKKVEESPKKPATPEKMAANVFKCPYYTVHLPDNWRAVLPPEEREGLVNAIFARNTNSTVISMIIGPRAGADAKMIATMFAEQFKAPKAPVERNGQYIFSFMQNDALEQKTIASTSCVSVDGDEFMITTWSGNQKEAQNFLKNNIESENYSQLLPK